MVDVVGVSFVREQRVAVVIGIDLVDSSSVGVFVAHSITVGGGCAGVRRPGRGHLWRLMPGGNTFGS